MTKTLSHDVLFPETAQEEVMVEAPERIQPKSLVDYLGIISKAVFQTGISWEVFHAKWPGTRDVFHGFDPATITRMTGAELEQLTGDIRIIMESKNRGHSPQQTAHACVGRVPRRCYQLPLLQWQLRRTGK